MKKILLIIIIASLCAQTADIQAMDAARRYGQQAKTTVSRGMQQAQPAVGQRMASARMKKEAFVNWAAPFLSEIGAALKQKNFRALPGILQKYKAQSAAAGVLAAAILTAIGLMIRALLRFERSETTTMLPGKIGGEREGHQAFVEVEEEEVGAPEATLEVQQEWKPGVLPSEQKLVPRAPQRGKTVIMREYVPDILESEEEEAEAPEAGEEDWEDKKIEELLKGYE